MYMYTYMYLYASFGLLGELMKPCGDAALAAGFGRSALELNIAEARIAALQVGLICRCICIRRCIYRLVLVRWVN